MLQFSVYCRIVNGEDAVDKHLERLKKELPEKGSVRFLQITDRQYAAMKLLLGVKTKKENSWIPAKHYSFNKKINVRILTKQVLARIRALRIIAFRR